MNRIFLAATAAIVATSANAADLNRSGGFKDAPVAIVDAPWTGFYVGVNGGYADAWGNGVNFHDTGSWVDHGTPFTDDLKAGLSPNGWFGGAGLGYNVQNGNFVFGLEADIQGGSITDSSKITVVETGNLTHAGAVPVSGGGGFTNGSATVTDIGTATVPTCTGAACGSYTIYPSGSSTGTTTALVTGSNTITLAPGDSISYSGVPGGTKLTAISEETWKTGEAKSSIDWFATVRGRMGYLLTPSFMPYLTGGLAIADVKNTLVAGDGSFSSSGTQTGWAFGGGVEYKFAPNWSLKAEYLHLDFGSSTQRPDVALPANVKLTAAAVDNSLDIVRVGVNLHLGGYTAPLK